MKLVVGLGNPGKRYLKTRHNAGYFVVDELANKFGVEDWNVSKKGKLQYLWVDVNNERVGLIKPQTFMNESGFSLAYICRKHRELEKESIYVVHDDLDLKLGEYKIQKRKGPKEHKGLMSVYEKLGTKDFWHVRVGVDNRNQEIRSSKFEAQKELEITDFQGSKQKRISGERYVLQDFTDKDLEILNLVIDRIIEEMMARLIN